MRTWHGLAWARPSLPRLVALCLIPLATVTIANGQDCELGRPSVFRLEPTPVLERLDTSRLAPDDLLVGRGPPVIVAVVFPMPCNERLVRAVIRLWNGYAVARNRPGLEGLFAAAAAFRPETRGWLPLVEAMGAPDPGRFRLQRKISLGRRSMDVTNVGDYGLVVFPVVSGSMTTATFTIRTERSEIMRKGKARRIRSAHEFVGIRIPGPGQPAPGLSELQELLGWPKDGC